MCTQRLLEDPTGKSSAELIRETDVAKRLAHLDQSDAKDNVYDVNVSQESNMKTHWCVENQVPVAGSDVWVGKNIHVTNFSFPLVSLLIHKHHTRYSAQYLDTRLRTHAHTNSSFCLLLTNNFFLLLLSVYVFHIFYSLKNILCSSCLNTILTNVTLWLADARSALCRL